MNIPKLKITQDDYTSRIGSINFTQENPNSAFNMAKRIFGI
jgi:hypothetical protein